MSAGRPREFNPDIALDAAMQLFWRQGYEATSLQQLLEAMGLSKSSLYQTFGNKRDLFCQCIDRYQEQMMSNLAERLEHCQSGIDFVSEMLFYVISEVNDVTSPRGCLVTNTASEFAQADAEIAQRVNVGLAGFQAVFAAAVRKGQDDGSVSQAHRADALAHYLVTSMSGLRTMVKAGAAADELQETIKVITASLR